MRRNVMSAAMAVIAIEALVAGQGKDVNQVLADAHAALGGDKIATVKTITGVGRTLRTGPGGNTTESEFEMAMELPDKYLMRSVMVSMGNMSVFRNSGFNGGQVIEEIDRPPNLQGGNIVIRIAGPGGTVMDPAKMTPEQRIEADRLRLLSNKKEFTRLTLGMFASSLDAFPLEFTYGGQAESADGKADVINVKGQGEFAVTLFLDAQTHMPLMVSWMDKEPLVIQTTSGPGGAGGTRVVQQIGGGGAVGGGSTFTAAAPTTGAGGAPNMSKEDMEKMQKDFEQRRKEAEAKRRTVEFRVYYSEYKSVGGVKLPFKIQRSIDGKPTEEMLFDTIKLNPKIDASKFAVTK
ncbi:MAG: hypothetical protein NT151_02505 [Acidobacteria bacterium]|nr:hypothetical protein [Acidobacteriota bacterium]